MTIKETSNVPENWKPGEPLPKWIPSREVPTPQFRFVNDAESREIDAEILDAIAISRLLGVRF